MHIGEVSRV